MIMLCLGGVYAWSILTSELRETYHFSAAQTQVIFGTLISVFSISMVFVPRLARVLSARILLCISALLFCSEYVLANFAGRLFWGFISDHMDAALSIFMALTLQACAIILQ
ncbi:MAG: hypothetical protein U5N26_04705 [Candidatus Marinimicrobia bacterium]|nr:hypothetical protein [Candidatus Neomarinimicrobiota bacterium]